MTATDSRSGLCTCAARWICIDFAVVEMRAGTNSARLGAGVERRSFHSGKYLSFISVLQAARQLHSISRVNDGYLDDCGSEWNEGET